jgi:hypothetical protein
MVLNALTATFHIDDCKGFWVIDEIPAVGLYFHNDTTKLAQRQTQCK